MDAIREANISSLVTEALEEDAPNGDITSEAVIDPGHLADATLIAKAPGVIAGTAYGAEAFRQCGVDCIVVSPDSTRVKPGDVVLSIEKGQALGILRAERTALNFLGHLCGIATAVSRFVDAVEGTQAIILDTRKTRPGFRAAEKAAVRAGGGTNHRFGLSDGILIKENHIRAAGGIRPAIQKAQAHLKVPHQVLVEVEVTNLDELNEAVESGAPRVLLDNMSLDQMREAAEIARKAGVQTEASGNITLENVREVALTGVDFISTGWITHSAPTLDLSLLIKDL